MLSQTIKVEEKSLDILYLVKDVELEVASEGGNADISAL